MSEDSKIHVLGRLVRKAAGLGKEGFLDEHREPVLIAMGVLESEEIRARRGSTVNLVIASPAAYDPTTVHPLAGQVYTVPVLSVRTGSIVIGRSAPAQIVVPDHAVSSTHCSVCWDSGEVVVKDAGSTNGTLLNLRRLQPSLATKLTSEDIITVGRHSFQYYGPLPFYRVLADLAELQAG